MLAPEVGAARTTVFTYLRSILARVAYAALTAILFPLFAPALSSAPQDSVLPRDHPPQVDRTVGSVGVAAGQPSTERSSDGKAADLWP